MKQLTLSILLMLLPLMASADAVEIDGIYYNLVFKAKTAEVTSNPNKYSGKVIIPESVKYEGTTYNVIGINHAFNSCHGLTSITIPSSVKSIKGDYYGCDNLSSVYITDLEAWCNIIFGGVLQNPLTSAHHLFLNDKEIQDLVIPTSITKIQDYAFDGCSGLTSVTFSNNITSIGKYAFQNCSHLSFINIPNSITKIEEGTFINCGNLTSVSIPNSVISIGTQAFAFCKKLASITIPNSVTKIGLWAFQECVRLNTITIGNGITYIDQEAFVSCSEITDIYCHAEKIPNTNKDAFKDSYIEYVILHMPASAINAYKTTEPWSSFKEFVALSGDGMSKCATPTIIFENGKLLFNCKTEGVEFVSEITTTDTKKYYDSELTPTFKYKVSVYTTKIGYENSDTATLEITASGKFGDLDSNGKVDVADHVKLTEIIMNQ